MKFQYSAIKRSAGAAAAAALLLTAGAGVCAADEIVYRPINPAFGGNPLNSGFLLSTAGEQRPRRPDRRGTPLERFAETIQASLLNRISQEIANSILGENAQNEGSFAVGDTRIDFVRQGGQVEIVVTNPDGSVTLEVPVADFL